MLAEQKLGQSGLAFLFNDADRIVGHPEMSRLMAEIPERQDDLPQIGALKLPGAGADHPLLAQTADRRSSSSPMTRAGPMSRRSTGSRPPARPISGSRWSRRSTNSTPRSSRERRTLFALALGLRRRHAAVRVLAGLADGAPLRELVEETDEIQRFEIAERPRIHSTIAEIDELGRSVFTMRSVVRSFSSFIPRTIVRQLIEIRLVAAPRRHPARGHGAVHRRRRLHRQDREGRSVAGDDLHLALFRGAVGRDHEAPGHGRQISSATP